MRPARNFLFFAWAVALSSMLGCSHADMQNEQMFLDKVSHAPESELPKFLYGYGQSPPGAQRVLINMLRPIRAPDASQHMKMEAVQQSGRFTLIVAQVPWLRDSQPGVLQPVITTGSVGNEQVVGYILPFDDISALISASDKQSIMELTSWWVLHYGKRAR
jgi:hypothetical protein